MGQNSRKNACVRKSCNLWPYRVNMSEKWLQKLFTDKQRIFHTNFFWSKCLFRFFTLTILVCPPICARTEEEAKHCVYMSKLMMKLIEIQLYFMWEFLITKYFLFHLLKYLSGFLFTAKWKSFPVTLCSNIYIKSRLLHCVFHFSPEYIFLLTKKICKILSQRA